MAQILGYAVVYPDGGFRGSGVSSIDHQAPGVWRIFFDFNVAKAIEVASLANIDEQGVINAFGDPNIGPNEVTVQTWTSRLLGLKLL